MRVRITENIYLSDGSCVPESTQFINRQELECHLVDGKMEAIIYAPKGAIGVWDEDECAVFTDDGNEYYIPKAYTESL
jgi:hypothetical protein